MLTIVRAALTVLHVIQSEKKEVKKVEIADCNDSVTSSANV